MNFIVDFEIELWRNSTGSDKMSPTGTDVDQHVRDYLNLSNSVNPITRMMPGFKVVEQWWDQSEGHLLVHLYSEQTLDSKALTEVLNMASPDEGGPDTWMESDIRLPEPYREFEVVPIIRKMWVYEDNQWKQVDLHTLLPDIY